MKICPNGHLTGTKTCGTCGKKCKGVVFHGAGRVLVAKHERPRDENGLNTLDQLRGRTRGGPLAKGAGAVAQRSAAFSSPLDILLHPLPRRQ